MYVEHQMIEPKTIEKRLYQEVIAKSCLERSTLVVLPTGIGKTVIALMVIAEILRNKKGKILFMAPTKPLVEQHARFLKKHLAYIEEAIVLTGEIPPAKRKSMWTENQIITATPQVISNDLISGQIDLNSVSLIIFDEAHRAVGDYAYVFIAEKYAKVKGGLVMGTTASPGNNKEKILEVCGNLGIEGVEIRHDYDPDVVRYIHDMYIRWVEVRVPAEMSKILKFLEEEKKAQVQKLQQHGYLKIKKYVTTKELLMAQGMIQSNIKRGNVSAYEDSVTQAVAMKLNHGLELAETQGLNALRTYFEKLVKESRSRGASKASKKILSLPKVQLAMRESKKLEIQEIENPKLNKVVQIVSKQLKAKPDSRIIVFTHYRDTSELVKEELSKINGVRPARFVGQASKGDDKGLRQKQQVELIDKFTMGEVNVLVATSVAEEGLDIPSTDMVVFYEPVPSEIRTIQRRGRTGRQRAGKVFILITKGTRDEAYYWSSKHKESRMHKELEKLRKELKDDLLIGGPTAREFENIGEKKPVTRNIKQIIEKQADVPQKTLGDFQPEQEKKEIKIIVDTREFNSSVVRALSRLELIVESKQLDVGDYIISERVGIERKEVQDFHSSLMDGRLFQQIKALKRSYVNPLIIIEGEELYSRSGVGKAAIFGSLASIIVDFGIPIISTKDSDETAGIIAAIAKREASEGRTPAIRSDKGTMLLQERQQFIIEGLPNVSAVISQRLLAYFGSVSAILNADVKELQKVKGVGKVIAEGIREVLDTKYYSKTKE